MATRSLTTVSSDSNVIQELHWDTLSKKIEVTHMINLDKEINVRWRLMDQASPGSVKHAELCRDYSIAAPKSAYLTVFVYDEYKDTSWRDAHAVKFPETGDYYPISELNHYVHVTLNKVPSGTTSKTSGEALSS